MAALRWEKMIRRHILANKKVIHSTSSKNFEKVIEVEEKRKGGTEKEKMFERKWKNNDDVDEDLLE